MLDQSWQEEIKKQVRMPQIVVGALIAGVLMFAAIAIVMQSGDRDQIEAPDNAEAEAQGDVNAGAVDTKIIFLGIGVAAGVLALLLHRVIAGAAVAKGRRSIQSGQWAMPKGSQAFEEMVSKMGDAGKLFLLFQARTVTAGSILEGAAFFNLVAYIITSQVVHLGVAGVMVLCLVFLIFLSNIT